jgi:hypothetical protein
VQGANNVGDIYVNQCEFAYLGRGIDARGNGFLMSIQFYTGANNQECDIFLSDSNTVINGLASQGSSRMVSGGSPASSCMINAAWWAGNYTPEIDSSYPVVVYEGSLVMTGCNLQTTKITDINSFASPDVMLGACQVEHDQFGFTTSFVSIGNTYGNAIQFNALSPSGGDDNYVNGRPTSNATFQSQNCRIFSVGDVGLPIGAPPSTNFAPYFGSNIQVGPQQLPMQSGATPVPPAGVIVKNAGSLIGSVAKFTIPASALTSSSPMTLTLCAPWNKTKIKAVYADVTSPFAGGGANTATLQVGKTVGGTATPGSYLGGTIGLNLVSGSLGAQPYGSNAGDLGPDLSTPVQGGALVWGATSGVPGTQQWSLTASFSWTGSLSPSGSVDLYVVYEVFPGWDLT